MNKNYGLDRARIAERLALQRKQVAEEEYERIRAVTDEACEIVQKTKNGRMMAKEMVRQANKYNYKTAREKFRIAKDCHIRAEVALKRLIARRDSAEAELQRLDGVLKRKRLELELQEEDARNDV